MRGEQLNPFSPVETDDGDIVPMANNLSTDGILLTDLDEERNADIDEGFEGNLQSSALAAHRIVRTTGEIATRPVFTDAEIIARYDAMTEKEDKYRDSGLNPALADPEGLIRSEYEAMEARRQKEKEENQARLAKEAYESMRIENQQRALKAIELRTPPRDVIKATNEFLARERARQERRARPYGS